MRLLPAVAKSVRPRRIVVKCEALAERAGMVSSSVDLVSSPAGLVSSPVDLVSSPLELASTLMASSDPARVLLAPSSSHIGETNSSRGDDEGEGANAPSKAHGGSSDADKKELSVFDAAVASIPPAAAAIPATATAFPATAFSATAVPAATTATSTTAIPAATSATARAAAPVLLPVEFWRSVCGDEVANVRARSTFRSCHVSAAATPVSGLFLRYPLKYPPRFAPAGDGDGVVGDGPAGDGPAGDEPAGDGAAKNVAAGDDGGVVRDGDRVAGVRDEVVDLGQRRGEIWAGDEVCKAESVFGSEADGGVEICRFQKLEAHTLVVNPKTSDPGARTLNPKP